MDNGLRILTTKGRVFMWYKNRVRGFRASKLGPLSEKHQHLVRMMLDLIGHCPWLYKNITSLAVVQPPCPLSFNTLEKMGHFGNAVPMYRQRFPLATDTSYMPCLCVVIER